MFYSVKHGHAVKAAVSVSDSYRTRIRRGHVGIRRGHATWRVWEWIRRRCGGDTSGFAGDTPAWTYGSRRQPFSSGQDVPVRRLPFSFGGPVGRLSFSSFSSGVPVGFTDNPLLAALFETFEGAHPFSHFFAFRFYKSAIYPTPTYVAPQLQPVPLDSDLTNTTIFVGGLDPNVSEEELKQIFAQFGDLIYVKIPLGKGCGFVQFGTRSSAEEAIQRVHGTVIGQQMVRLSWGRSPAHKQDQTGVWGQQADSSQWGAYYGYGQGYDAYAYGAQDPNLYAYGAYNGYGQYPQQTDSASEVAAVTAPVPGVEQREVYDPLAIPDVDKLNAAYLSVHGRSLVGKPLWLTTSGEQHS